MTSSKTQLIGSIIIPRWRTAYCFWSKYFENQPRYEKVGSSYKTLKVLSNETELIFGVVSDKNRYTLSVRISSESVDICDHCFTVVAMVTVVIVIACCGSGLSVESDLCICCSVADYVGFFSPPSHTHTHTHT